MKSEILAFYETDRINLLSCTSNALFLCFRWKHIGK